MLSKIAGPVAFFLCFAAASLLGTPRCGTEDVYVASSGEILGPASTRYAPVSSEVAQCWYFYWRVNQSALTSADDKLVVQHLMTFYRRAYEDEFLMRQSSSNLSETPVPRASGFSKTAVQKEATKDPHVSKSLPRANQPSLSHLDPYVRDCVDTRSGEISTGASSWTDGVYHQPVPPRWFERQSDSVRLTFVAHSTYVNCRNNSERNALDRRIKEDLVRDCVRPFYKGYGIDLNLVFGDQLNQQSRNAPGVALTIDCHGKPEDYRATHWVVSELDRDEACGTLTHEIGHWLGLVDEYPDPRVPNRAVGPVDSVMRTCRCHPRNTRLYPQHLRKILGAYCG